MVTMAGWGHHCPRQEKHTNTEALSPEPCPVPIWDLQRLLCTWRHHACSAEGILSPPIAIWGARFHTETPRIVYRGFSLYCWLIFRQVWLWDSSWHIQEDLLSGISPPGSLWTQGLLVKVWTWGSQDLSQPCISWFVLNSMAYRPCWLTL